MKWSRSNRLTRAIVRLWLRRVMILALFSTLGVALVPRPALAACGALDLGACVDAAEYSFYYGLAGMGWAVDRTLLQLAYQLDQFRWYLVETAFTAAYQLITAFVSPVYIPVATVALLLACVLLMLVPITGALNIVKLRHVILWIVLTPICITVGGQLITQAEQIRSQIGSSLFAQAAGGAPGAIFGSTASDMPSPKALYPSNPCGSGTLVRRDGAAMHMDDLAAALLYATAQDIHCPDRGGPSPDIPDAFYATPPGYAFDGYVGNLNSEVERRSAVEGMQRGMTRLFQGTLPCLLAVAESLLNLLFSLSLLVLWIGVPLGLMFVYFQQTATGVTGLFRRAVSVFQTSWSSSVVMGLLFSCLLAAARLGNATAYTGFAIGALLLTMYLCLVAGKTLLDSVLTLNTTVQSATGLSVTQPIELAATVGAAALTGGATMAVAGLAASERTKSNTYALGAMAGRLPAMADIGEVAAAMGWLDTEGAAYSGLYAGERSTHSWRSFRLQAERDAQRFALGGTSDRKAAGSATNTRALATPAAPQAWAELALDQLGGGAQRLILAADLAQARHDPVLRASALHLNEQQQAVYTERASYPTLAALHAVSIPRGEANISRLLMDGYHVQENPGEATVSYWKPGKPARTGVAAETEASVSGTPTPDGSAAPAVPSAAPPSDSLARIEGQIATLSAQIAGLHSGAGAPATGSAGAGGADQQLEQIEAAVDQSRLATDAEQDELERQIASDSGRAESTSAAPAGQRAAMGSGGPANGEAITRSGGLTPVPQSNERDETVLRQLDGEITATQQSLDQIGQAQDADAQAQRAQLERTINRLRTARTAVEQRVARTAQASSRSSEETP